MLKWRYIINAGIGGVLAACQPYTMAMPVVAVPVVQPMRFAAHPAPAVQAGQPQSTYKSMITYQQPAMIRTEITLPAYVDKYGRVMVIDYNGGYTGPSGYGRAVIAPPR